MDMEEAFVKKILVLEDEASIRSFIVINLRRAGYDVIEAETGEEALERLRAQPGYQGGAAGHHAAGTSTALRSAAASAPPTRKSASSC